MKLTAMILLAGFLQLSARTSAQQRISLTLKNASLDKIFAEIEKRSGYTVFYNIDVLKSAAGPISIDVKDATIDEILKTCLKGLPLEFAIQEKTIFIKKEARKLSIATPSGPTNPVPETFSGIVKSDAGTPLAGATVFVPKLKKTAITDKDGQFTLKNVPDGNYDVQISFVGYEPFQTKTDIVNHQGWLAADLKRSISKLDESVVIAYGTTTNRLNTSDVTTVTGKEIESQPVSNPLAALEGRVPGLAIAQATGIPGGAITVQIRGQNSLTNGNDPFYVIDGVPYSSQTVGLINFSLNGNFYLNGSNNATGNPLNYINPSDIESISVLKDADATSIYGSRAANGAILITTKKGKAGETRIDINAYSGVAKVSRQMKLLNTQQYLTMRHEAFNNDGATPSSNSDFDLTFWDTTRYTNWQKVMIGNQAHYDDAQASASGGNENTQYLLGGGYHRETTVFPGTNADADQKASGHFSIVNTSSNKRFKISATASYLADMSNVPTIDLTPYALLPPDAPALHKPDGTLNWDPIAQGQAGTWSNPLANLFNVYKGRTNNFVANAIATYTLLPGLNLSTSFGYTHTQTTEVITNPTTSIDPGYNVTSGQSVFNATNTASWIVEPQLNYTLALGKGVLKTLVGTTYHENTLDGQVLTATGFSSDALLQDIQAATTVTVESTQSAEYKYNAVFARLGYDWQDKYLVNVSARRDGSSRFGPGSQFANFAAIGGAWIFSKEDFFQNNLPFVSFGKLRASYGTSGNDQIGDYRFLNLYSLTRYPYQNTQGLYPATLFNPNLAWEINKKLEAGLMIGFLKDRFTVEVSYYVNKSGNQLLTEPLSSTTGFLHIPINLNATVQNYGVEATFNSINLKTRNFTWTTSFNVSAPKNKLIAFPGLATSPYQNAWELGKPITAHKEFGLAGVNDSAGIYQFATSKGGPSFNPVNPTDFTALVNTAPRLYGGFQNSFSYKGLQLDILFQFVKQTSENINGALGVAPGFMSNQPTKVLDRWQRPGDNAPYQQFTQTYSSNAYNSYGYYTSSNAVFTDASFIRLKNLSLSYSVPESTLKKAHLRNLRLYVNAQNLLTITKYLGFDPETQGTVLPPLKVWVAGIQFAL